MTNKVRTWLSDSLVSYKQLSTQANDHRPPSTDRCYVMLVLANPNHVLSLLLLDETIWRCYLSQSTTTNKELVDRSSTLFSIYMLEAFATLLYIWNIPNISNSVVFEQMSRSNSLSKSLHKFFAVSSGEQWIRVLRTAKMPGAMSFRQTEKPSSFVIDLMLWSPKTDLIPVTAVSGEVVLFVA